MRLTAEELTGFLNERGSAIAAIVEPAGVEVALAEIHKRIWKRLDDVADAKSLDSLVKVEAVDFAVKRYYKLFCHCEKPDHASFEALFKWHDRFVEAEVGKTIRIHLAPGADAQDVMADVRATLWEVRDDFDRDKGPFVPWVRAIALNKARSFGRSKVLETSIETGKDRRIDLPSSSPSPEDAVVDSERPADTEGPPSESFVEILRMVQEFEPHEAIAFLFNRYLGVKPEQIALRIRELSLPDALAEVVNIVRLLHPEIAGIDTLLAPLAGRVNGLVEKFGQFVPDDGDIEREIGRWAARVHRSVRGTILQMGKKFLRLVCDLSAAAHEITCFLWIRFLYSPPVALRHVGDRELMRLIEIFHESYSRRALLSITQVESCTSDLRRRIPHGRSLNDFGGADLYISIKRWCDHVRLLIEGSSAAGHMLGYAYITGSLTKGKTK
jgi:DNA-directed RNA polymerase specialized sigma24 family protein